jgi:signal transduction histidine kinase/DNA-binding response OmpR family regulator/ligand-binding sensor domain-containing protein
LNFTEVDGLPRDIINCLAQDKYGYVWIGTNNGVARFDGKNFKIYNELKNYGIISLLYDSNHKLWVATHLGLFKYNPATDYFELVTSGYISKLNEDKGSIYFLMASTIYRINGVEIQNLFHVNDISDFCFSKEGLWVSKNNNGVLLYDRKDNFSQPKASYLQDKQVASIAEVEGVIFVGMFDGQLYVISGNSNTHKIDLDNHYFYKAIKKVDNEVWVATDGNGIFILDANFKFIKKLDRSQNAQGSINSNSIYDILTGENGEIWLASYGAGLTCILPDNRLFQNIFPEKGNENSLVANEGVSVLVKEPYVYFGTNYGLSKWDKNLNQYKNLSEKRLRSELNGTKVTAICVDSDNTLWIGTYDGLLGHYTSDLKLIKTYHPCSQLPNEMQQIVDIKEVGKNNLVILTQFHYQILLNFEKSTGQVSVFELLKKGSKNTYCLLNSLRTNQHGELLAVITNLGLFHINWKDNVLENRLPEMNSNLNTDVTDFYQDKSSNYWVSTSSVGLIFVTTDGKIIKKWTGKDGLPSDALIRMESVDDRYLWIGTISGICRFDMKTFETLNFNHRDGLPANEFKERVSATINDGRIIFGSLAGFTIIDPSKVDIDGKRPEVVISDITFQNQSIRNHEGKKYIDQPLEETKEIALPYDKNSFSIHFFIKNKSFSQYHNYEYRLVGLEENWNYQGETNFATYTNLSPGNYTFEIRSSDNSQEGLITRLQLRIQPPWYMNLYAYLAYMLIFFTILYLSFYALLKRIELKKEKEFAELKLMNEQELTEKKLAFFTNISHDLKTPLTLIDAPVNDLLQSDNLSPEQVNKLTIVDRNAKRLYKLITDLLDFRKITQKEHVLEVRETSLPELLSDIVEAFSEECKNKSIVLNHTNLGELSCYVDAKKIEKIVWNLLSNALKFTNKGGQITLAAEEVYANGNRFLKLVVEDNGIGIADADRDKIFNSFYKVKDSGSEGTGIGLSIVKELVEIHHGTIEVETALGAGAKFTVLLPSEKAMYSEGEIATQDSNSTQPSTIVRNSSVCQEDENTEAKPKLYNLPTLLITEDNIELREYLAVHFEKRYKVFQANDGVEGLHLAKEINPDIILTDVQMPKLNGYAFCKEIRQNFDTSHIPVVMLTANDTTENQIEGLSTGADAYLTKPFDIKLLDTVLNSVLENRKKLRHKFMGNEPQNDLDKTLPPKDLEFIVGLKLFIEENIMNQDLNVDLLSDHFAVSLAQLHRKIKSLTGSTPNNLIKSIRLKKAYKLISDEGFRVSEAAYQTGFSDPNYFTTCFKKEFGVNPSQITPPIK